MSVAMQEIHSSHRSRFSDASSFDEICELCGATDNPLSLRGKIPGNGNLTLPCSASDEKRREYDKKREKDRAERK